MYSQGKEEQIILNYFKGVQRGTLLDLGANDGKTFSNTRALVERCWRGALVEPSSIYERLVYNSRYWNVKTYKIALGTENGEMDFYESGSLITPVDHALVSTLKQSEIDRWKGTVDYKKTTVQVMDWKTFLAQCDYKTFDFISIDIEGMDLEVLRQMDLKALGCKMLCVEFNGKNQGEFDKLVPFPLIFKNGENLIYAI